MSTTPAAPTSVETPAAQAEAPPEKSFLTKLQEFGEQIIPAERPVQSELSKVLGGLIHWIDQGGEFEVPESFNPALSQAVAEQEAEQSRLAAQNAELSTRLASLETLMRQTIAAQPAPVAAPPTASGADTPSEAAAPVAAAPAPAVPGVPSTSPTPVAAAPPVEAAPALTVPPVSE